MTTRRLTPRMLNIDVLLPHKQNVRDDLGDLTELAASIKAQGLLQPIVVTPHPYQSGKYLILAGHRRAAAAKSIPLINVPCVVREDAGSANEQVALMLVENMQRSNLSAVEKARAMKKLIDGGMNQTEVGRRLGVAPSVVNTYVMLLDLSDEDLATVESGEVTIGHAREIVKKARAKARVDRGSPMRGRPAVIEGAHFTPKHPLADTAAAFCTHTMRPYVHRMVAACGQCWEQAIREDALATLQDGAA